MEVKAVSIFHLSIAPKAEDNLMKYLSALLITSLSWIWVSAPVAGQTVTVQDTQEICSGPNDVCRFGLSWNGRADLIRSVSLPSNRVAWSGNYWPYRNGGIGPLGRVGVVERRILSEQDARSLDADEISRLSPAEKFDLARGIFDMVNDPRSLVRFNELEIERAKYGGLLSWEGICNGWSEAALLIQLPDSLVSVRNNIGQVVTFDADDFAALFSRFFEDLQNDKYRTCGGGACPAGCTDGAMGSCRPTEWVHQGRYLGDYGNGMHVPLSPGAFHVASTKIMSGGQEAGWSQGIIADMSPDNAQNGPPRGQIWNHPIVSIDYEYAYPNIPNRIDVFARIQYVNEAGPANAGGQDMQDIKTRIVGYRLEVNDSFEVVPDGSHAWFKEREACGSWGACGLQPHQLWLSDTTSPSTLETRLMREYEYPIEWDYLVGLLNSGRGYWRAPKYQQ